jgi:hypothetical protein
VSLVHTTMADNAVWAAQVWNTQPALGSTLWITNSSVQVTGCILSCAVAQTNVWGPLADGGHNLCSDESASFTSPTSRSGIDPLLGPLADNGGPTSTLALLPTSPAIDAGDATACPATVQRGVRRPQGRACDIGAFELEPELTLRREPGGVVRHGLHVPCGPDQRGFGLG